MYGFFSTIQAIINKIPPRINSSIERLSRHKQRMFNKACISGSPTDWSQYKLLKKSTQQGFREAHRLYLLRLIDPLAIKTFGRILKVNELIILRCHHYLTVVKSSLIRSKDKANILLNHFSSVFTQEDTHTE